MLELDLLNNLCSSKFKRYLLIFALISFSIFLSILNFSILTIVAGTCLLIFWLQLYQKGTFKFEKQHFPIFTTILAIPMMVLDIYLMTPPFDECNFIIIIMIVLSLYASVFLSLLFSTYIANRIGFLFLELSKKEIICFFVFVLLINIPVIFAHMQSCIFGFNSVNIPGTDRFTALADAVFVTDSGILRNAFWYNWSAENDLRQCLFAIFARPIYCYAYVVRLHLYTHTQSCLAFPGQTLQHLFYMLLCYKVP